jgi:hypothetical protein
MIEQGTHEEIKKSILGNMTFQPTADTLKQVKKCFEAQELKVQVTTIKYYQCGKGNSFHQWPVVVVTFFSKRTVQGAMAKTLRAIRAARLSMYQFNDHGKREDGTHAYAVELREHE